MLKTLLSSLVVTATLALSCSPAVAEMGNAPQIVDKQGVKITVAPRNIRAMAKSWEFEVTMESHTRDLSDDLSKSAMLIADGKQYRPLAWNGAPPGGHHRKGILSFKAMASQPPSMELQIRLADDAAPRSFKWQLK